MSVNIFADLLVYVISKTLFPAHYPVNFLDFEFWQKIKGTTLYGLQLLI